MNFCIFKKDVRYTFYYYLERSFWFIFDFARLNYDFSAILHILIIFSLHAYFQYGSISYIYLNIFVLTDVVFFNQICDIFCAVHLYLSSIPAHWSIEFIQINVIFPIHKDINFIVQLTITFKCFKRKCRHNQHIVKTVVSLDFFQLVIHRSNDVLAEP